MSFMIFLTRHSCLLIRRVSGNDSHPIPGWEELHRWKEGHFVRGKAKHQVRDNVNSQKACGWPEVGGKNGSY